MAPVRCWPPKLLGRGGGHVCSVSGLDRSSGRLWGGSVGREGRPEAALRPGLAGAPAGRSVGAFRPQILFAALRAAGRSVGADRVGNAKNRKKGSVGQGRRVYFQLRIP